jgi:hypothetical protein
MSFATLAVISLVAIVGPLLALPRRWHLPVILGELAAGIVLGTTGSVRLQARNETFTREKAGCWTRQRAFAQVRQGQNIQLLPYPLVRS